MAKRSIMGVISGKLGNMVGQKNSLVSNKDKQVWRVYQGNVANPKTVKQAHQRSLFVAAKNFQRALEDILNHSWQGVDYGTKSLNHFRKLVLAGGGSGFPFFYQPKGAQNFIPQPWPLSRGSININTACTVNEDSQIIVAGLKAPLVNPVPNPLKVKDIWAAFLAKNPQMQDGDMITVVAFVSTGIENPSTSSVYVPVYDRFIINTSDENTKDSLTLKSQKNLFSGYFANGSEEVGLKFELDSTAIVVSCGVIISRQNGTKPSWLRNKADMYLNPNIDYSALFGSDAWTTACLDTFMNSTNAAESDWYLNQTGENDDEEQGGGGGDTPSQTIAIESKEAALTPSGSVNAAYLTKGSLRGYIMYNAQYFVIRGNDVVAQSFDEGKSFSPSLTTIELNEGLMAEIEATGYHFLFPIEPDKP